jgi:hypothetical protein
MSGPDQEGGGDSSFWCKTRKYEKQVFKKKLKIENFNTSISKKHYVGVSLFEMPSGRFWQMRVVTSTTLTEIMEFYTGI